MKRKYSLYSILSKHYTRFALVPIILIELVLLIMYFSINHYIAGININHLEQEAFTDSTNLLKREADRISSVLAEVSRSATIMQKNHEEIFAHPERYNITKPEDFRYAPNGVFYKENKEGASLYYSSKTKIGKKELAKAALTSAMDPLLKDLVETNPNIVAAYFNSYDDMNRLYPFIDKVYEQYGEHIHMEDYNFYYLADAKHDPAKTPVWTDAYLDPAGNGWMMSCVAPVYNNGFLEGVSGLDITIDSFVKNILEVSLPNNAQAFMVDTQGTILAMPGSVETLLGLKELKEHVYSNAITETVTKPEEYNLLKNESPFASHFRKMFKNKLGSADLDISGNSYITIQQIVKETGWHLMILINKADILSYVNEYKSLSNRIGYFAIVLMALFYVIFFSMFAKKSISVAKEITTPVEELTEYTSQMWQKGFEPKIIDTQVQEIYQLSNDFSKMAEELQVHKNHLEELVDERTAQLRESETKYITLYTQAEATNQKLKQAQMTIIQQEKMASIGQLAAGIAHELNNPIGFVSSNFTTLKVYLKSLFEYYHKAQETIQDLSKSAETPSPLDEMRAKLRIDYIEQDISEIFNESEEGFKRVTTIVNNLRSFSRIDMEEMHMYSVNEGIENTLVVAKNEIKYVADVNTEYGELENIEANGGQINQVFLNIVINAAQAIKEQNRSDRGTIDIRTRQDGGWIYCSIKDDGPGIPDQYLSRIFDPFFTTKEPGKGTGLGLNISYDIVVNMHHGKIDVSSSDKGTEFTIALPLRQKESKQQP